MLWPEGSMATLADIGGYLEPPLPDERACSFCVSRAGAYIAVATPRVLAMFRARPLSPLAIYPDLFQSTEIKDVIASPSGSHLAVLTADNRVTTFAVRPRHDIEEVLKTTYAVTPGPGEAIGVRELWLEASRSMYLEDDMVSLDSAGTVLVGYGRHGIYFAPWSALDNSDVLAPLQHFKYTGGPPQSEEDAASDKDATPTAEEAHTAEPTEKDATQTDDPQTGHASTFDADILGGCVAVLCKDEWLSSLITAEHVFVQRWSSTLSAVPLATATIVQPGVVAIDYNARMRQLVYVTQEGKVLVKSDVFSSDDAHELPLEGRRTAQTVQWTPAGTAVLVGFADGWQLLTMLGLSLYNYSESSTVSESLGVCKAQWLVGAEAVVLLGTDGRLRIQNMLRWNGLSNTARSRPVLHGNGRLMLYHDPSARGLSQSQRDAAGVGSTSTAGQTWLTIPLPTWYMAQNWPIAHICSSPDGKFVAVSGAIGIMMFSVASRQWKEVGGHDFMVRGGLAWHGRRLVAATVSADSGTIVLKMYSPIIGSNTKNSSANLLKSLWPGRPPVNQPLLPMPGDHRAGSAGLPRAPASIHGSTTSVHSSSVIGSAGQAAGAHAGAAHGEAHAPGGTTTHASTGHLSPGTSGLGHRRRSTQDVLHGLDSPGTPSSPGTAASSTINIAGLGNTTEQQVIATDVLGRGVASTVSLMAVGPQGLLGVLTGAEGQRLLVYDLSSLEFDLVRDLPLAEILAGPGVPPPAIRAFTILSETQLLVLASSTLFLVSSLDERQFERRILAEPIEQYEYLPHEDQLWVFDGQDAVVMKWNPNCTTPESNTPESTTPELEAMEDEQDATGCVSAKAAAKADDRASDKFYANISLDAYPVHFSANRGVVTLVESEPVRSFDASYSVARLSTSHEVYVQYILESALVPAYNDAVAVARKYAKAPYFAGILESLMYRVVTNDEEDKSAKQKMLASAVRLLRQFPDQNFEAIVAGCARKVEMKYWTRLFEAVGKSPAQLFDQCLTKLDLETANEFLIVAQTIGTPEPEPVADQPIDFDHEGRVVKLYEAALKTNQLWICKQVCEFILALDPSKAALREFYAAVAPSSTL